MVRLTRATLLAVAAITLMWGLNWPVMKLSLREITPLWFRALTMTGGVVSTFVRRQDRFDINADLAPPPAGTYLLDVDLGVEKALGDQTLKVSLSSSNLTGARYREYTSLLRYFVDQPGRQIMLRLSIHFGTSRT